MILFDLDGTIANVDARRKAADQASDEFHNANISMDDSELFPLTRKEWWKAWQNPDNISRLDVPNELVVSVLRDWRERGKHVVIVSARNDKNRGITEQWLAKYGIHYDALYMRRDGDYRPDNVFKQELLDNIRKNTIIERVYDDRNQVVDMWRANGIDCIQVVPRDKGEF
jgi:HAD superfamily hydrolase (TIGR01549 family)